jgi:hypothetical protein
MTFYPIKGECPIAKVSVNLHNSPLPPSCLPYLCYTAFPSIMYIYRDLRKGCFMLFFSLFFTLFALFSARSPLRVLKTLLQLEVGTCISAPRTWLFLVVSKNSIITFG